MLNSFFVNKRKNCKICICFSKTALTAEQFKNGAEESGYSVLDVTDQTEYAEVAKNIYLALDGEKYQVVSRIDNTVIYVDADEAYKDDVKDFLKQLGY